MAHGKSLELRKIKAVTELLPIVLHPVGYANRHARRAAEAQARKGK